MNDKENLIKLLQQAASFLNDYQELLNALERHGTEDDVYLLIQDINDELKRIK